MTIATILAAGKSSRIKDTLSEINDSKIRDIAKNSQKCMIPINGIPFIEYQLENIGNAGYRDVCFVINPENGYSIKKRYGKNFGDINIEYAIQDYPRGQAHAVLCAQDVIGENDFIMVNSDNLYSPQSLSSLIDAGDVEWATLAFDAEGLIPGISREEVINKVTNWSTLEIDERKDKLYVIQRHEKHPEPSRFQYKGKILVDMTCGLYRNNFFDIARELHSRFGKGELFDQELYSATVQNEALQRGVPIRAFYVNEEVLDLTTCADIKLLEEKIPR